jgi:nitrous oxide reductase accessory protein NosL
MIRRFLNYLSVCLAPFLVAALGLAATIRPDKVGPKDRCPVCGMFVAKYPDFAAQVKFHDGQVFHFDGAKDMFMFYFNVARYAPGLHVSDVSAVYVTNYYELNLIDGKKALYVAGSDVYGPMGRELIPFANRSEAEDFLKDHEGKHLFRFQDVTPAVLSQLER